MKTKYLILISFLLVNHLNSQDQQKVDSLTKALEVSKDNTSKYNTLNNLWYQYVDNDIDQALKFSQDMIDLGHKSNIDTILTHGFERKAVTYAYMNNFDSSGVYFRKAENIYKKNKDLKRLAGVQRNLGQDHNVIGNLDSAYYYYDEAEKNYQIVDDSIGLASIYNSKSIVFLQKGYYNLALKQAFQSAAISEKFKDSIELVQNQMVIAAIYGEMKDTVNAISYHEKILDYFKQIKELRQQCATLILLSKLSINNAVENPKTEKRIQEALTIAKKLKDPSLEQQAKHMFSLLKFKQGKSDEAIRLLEEVVEYNSSN
ncbi:MAG: hypothetical protein AB3N18_11850, partial [Allomuricauda sp.]